MSRLPVEDEGDGEDDGTDDVRVEENVIVPPAHEGREEKEIHGGYRKQTVNDSGDLEHLREDPFCGPRVD